MTSAHGTFNTMQRHRTPIVPSATATLTQTEAGPSTHPVTLSSSTLRLRAAPAEQRRIQWAEDVIDNEGMGKKSSKVCCIYHAPRAVGESSSESDSSSSSESDSDSEPDTSRARPAGGSARRKPRPRHHHHDHDHNHEGHDCGDEASKPGDSSGKGKSVKGVRRRSPNAYEKMPKKSTKKEKN